MEQNTLDAFIEQLLAEKDFQDLETEVRDQLKSDLMSRAEDYINAEILGELSETDLLTFEGMLAERKSTEELQSFLASHVEHMDQVIAGALVSFHDTYIGTE